MNKWDRNYILTMQGNDGRLYEMKMPLTLEFSINFHIMASSNTGTFRIYNVSPDKREALYRDQFDFNDVRSLVLQAGYGQGTLPTIFQGNVKQAYSSRGEGATDYITEIEGYDMSFAMAKAFSNFTISQGTVTRQAVINRLLTDLLKTTPLLGVGYVGSFSGTYSRGRTICGPTWDALQLETGKSCFIYKSRVYVLNNNDAYDGVFPVISSETGLLSTPKRAQTYLTCDMIFEPTIELGQTILLQSNAIRFDGLYKVIGLEHSGVISGAINGKLKTKVVLSFGNEIFNKLTKQGLPELSSEGVLG